MTIELARPGRRPSAAVLAVACLVASACSSGGTQTSPVASPAPPRLGAEEPGRDHVAPVVEGAFDQPEQGSPVVLENLLRVEQLVRPTELLAPPVLAVSTWVVGVRYTEEGGQAIMNWADEPPATVIDLGGRRIDALVATDVAFLLTGDGAFSEYALDRVVDGRRVEAVTAGAVTRTGGPPELASTDSEVAWLEHRGGRSCASLLGPGGSPSEPLGCSDPDFRWSRLRPSRGAITVRETSPDGCRRAVTIAARGVRRDVGSCEVFDAVASGDATVMTITSLDALDLANVAIVASLDGARLDLGTAAAGSLVWCQGWAWWIHQIAAVDVTEVRRWQPGRSIEVVYRSPEDWAPTAVPACGARGVTTTRQFTGAGPSVAEAILLR